mmetsp:Transcript_78213/g.242508  ORF Transcript_78213/g.242508 Transcript_78213/m.242508 type:complete len:248 (-) Transcript_78213:226-969(-)
MSSIIRTSRLKSSMSPIVFFRTCFTARSLALSPPRFSFALRTTPKVPEPILSRRSYLSLRRAASLAGRWSQTVCGKTEAPKEPGPSWPGPSWPKEERPEDTHCDRLMTSWSAAACESLFDGARLLASGKLMSGPGAEGSKRSCGARAVSPTLRSTSVAVPGSPRSGSTSSSPAERFWPSSQRGSLPSLQITYLYSNRSRKAKQLKFSLVQIGLSSLEVDKHSPLSGSHLPNSGRAPQTLMVSPASLP